MLYRSQQRKEKQNKQTKNCFAWRKIRKKKLESYVQIVCANKEKRDEKHKKKDERREEEIHDGLHNNLLFALNFADYFSIVKTFAFEERISLYTKGPTLDSF